MKPSVLKRLKEHADAPRWNYSSGDHLDKADLARLARFKQDLRDGRKKREPGRLPEPVRKRLDALRSKVPSFRRRLPKGVDAEKHWDLIPCMSREDVALRPESLVPDDADLRRVMIYRTAGTTGHALLVPSAATCVSMYQPLLEFALARHGVRPRFSPDSVACFLVGAQLRTVTYPTTLSSWKGAGFAKLNLHAGDWPDPKSPVRYFADLAPQFLTGDPISFAEMLARGVAHRPAALVTTAVAMSDALRRRLAAEYRCPVIDWYSLTETGPLGYACPKTPGAYHLLPHDVYLEAVDAAGVPVAAGARGEITVTGGRNPFLPLLRYRTGDWGRLDYAKCACGDPMPRLLDLEGRAPVVFRRKGGALLNTVDISRVLREFPFVQHELIQRADLSCELTARPVGVGAPPPEKDVREALAELFGEGVELSIRYDPALGDRTEGGKAAPYRSELPLLED